MELGLRFDSRGQPLCNFVDLGEPAEHISPYIPTHYAGIDDCQAFMTRYRVA
jgi:hypothetical protein